MILSSNQHFFFYQFYIMHKSGHPNITKMRNSHLQHQEEPKLKQYFTNSETCSHSLLKKKKSTT